MMMRIVKCCFVLLVVCSTSVAQFKNIQLGEVTAILQGGEPSIAINKKNPNNLVVAAAPDHIYYTLDGGGTWQTQKLNSQHGVNGNPVLVSDGKGSIYSFHLSGSTPHNAKEEKDLDQILCHISNDGGKTWEQGGSVGLNAPKDNYRPWATVDSKDNVWVTWTQFDKFESDDENCQSNILLSTSSNGKKWSKPVQISQTPGNCKNDDGSTEGALAAVNVDGKAFVAWSNQDKIFLDRSFNGGSLWLTNDIAFGQQPGGWDMKVPGYARCSGMPVLMIDQSKGMRQGSLYVVWADQRNGENDTDIWFMRSTNFGDNWTSPAKLGDDKNKRHQYQPWMTVDQATGYIYIIYNDRDNYEDNQTDVMLAYSIDGGVTFKNVKVSESPFNPADSTALGGYNNISAHKGTIAPVWSRIDDGKISVWTAIIKQTDLMPAPQVSGKKKK